MSSCSVDLQWLRRKFQGRPPLIWEIYKHILDIWSLGPKWMVLWNFKKLITVSVLPEWDSEFIKYRSVDKWVLRWSGWQANYLPSLQRVWPQTRAMLPGAWRGMLDIGGRRFSVVLFSRGPWKRQREPVRTKISLLELIRGSPYSHAIESMTQFGQPFMYVWEVKLSPSSFPLLSNFRVDRIHYCVKQYFFHLHKALFLP